MSKGLTIPLSLDPRDWIQGIKVVERSLDGMEDDLDDVEDASVIMGRKLEDAFDDARRAADKTGRSVNDAERDVDGLTDEVSDSAKEFGSAFRGDPVEALEEVQSLASELATRFIPGIGGAVLAITGGAAFSALIGFYERWKEEQEARRQQVIEWRDTVLDAFGVVEQAEFGQIIKDAFDEAGIAGDTLEEQLKLLPEELRVAFRKAVQSGDLEGLKDVLDEIGVNADAIREKVAQGLPVTSPIEQAFLDIDGVLGDVTTNLDTAIDGAQSWARILGNDVTAAAPGGRRCRWTMPPAPASSRSPPAQDQAQVASHRSEE